MTLDDLLLEISYKLPKGYPTLVDGKFVDREEVLLINKFLLKEGLGELPLPPEKNQIILKEATSTDQKEITVCVVADLCNLFGTKMATALKSPDPTNVLSAASVTSAKQLAAILAKSRYNFYESNIPALISLLGLLGLDPKTKADDDIVINSIASGLAIYKRYKKVYLIRDDDNFFEVKKHGPKLWKNEFGETLFEDNWCPADIFISKTEPSSITSKALKATSLNTHTNTPALNEYFSNPKTGLEAGKFIGISLKQEQAQAGKGTKFTTNVLLGDVKEKTSTVNNDVKGIMIAYKGFARYESKPTKKDMKQPAAKILEKGLNVLQIKLNVKQGKELFDRLNLGEVSDILNNIGTIQNYHNIKNSKSFLKKQYNSLRSFIDMVNRKATKTAKNVGSIDEKKNMFIESRKNFVKALTKSNVVVKEVTSSEDLINTMEKKLQGTQFDIYMVQKISTYDFFVDIFNNWTSATKELKSYFKKMSAVSNPFVALAMFCIAEAGISPMFTKLKADHWDDFSHDYVIDAKKSAENVKVADSPTAGGFDASFNIYFGKTKSYSVKLSFRFADKSIRAEVVELKGLK